MEQIPSGRHRFHAFGGPCAVEFEAPAPGEWAAAAEAAEREALRIEHKYSRYRADSVLSRINERAGDPGGVIVDDETAQLLDYAATAHAQSGGLFDATSGVLRRAWDFRSGRMPQPGELDRLLPLVGWQQLRWQRPCLVLPVPGMELDFGGFGKEYAVDRVAALLLARGIRHGLVEFGGDLRILGPHPDGSPWRVGIRHPRDPEQAIAAVDLQTGAVATSGDYERFFEHDGRRYCHILDPRSGQPVAASLASVSVLAENCLVAGTLTTIAMLKGSAAPGWLDEAGLPWLGVGADGRIGGSLAARLN